MGKHLIYVFCITLIILAACNDEEITPRPYPRVRTHEVEKITSVGAIFNGEITFTSVPIEDHGFLWSENPGISAETTEKMSLGSRSEKGIFSASIERSLAEGVKYYMRAYAKSKEHMVYGNIQEFISLGSKAPKISSVDPTTGTWGDTVTIIGENFSALRNSNIVKFDEIVAEIIKNSADSIVCKVPHTLAKGPADISVSLFGNKNKLENGYQLIPPLIHSINPPTGTVNTEITITGEFFSPLHTKVFFDNTEATVTFRSGTEVICKVPEGLFPGNIKLIVQTGLGNLSAESTFSAKEPVITNISPLVATYNDVITITGEDFIEAANFNIVKFGNIVAQIISVSSTEIKVKVPVNLAVPSHVISLTYGSQVIVFSEPFSLLPPEIFEITPQKVFAGVRIEILGKNFSPLGNMVSIGGLSAQIYSNSSDKLEVYVPEPTSHELAVSVTSSGQSTTYDQMILSPWLRFMTAPLNPIGPYQYFYIDDSIFICQQDNMGSPIHHAFQFGSKTWSEKTAPPFDVEGSFSFSLNGKGYVGGGFSTNSLWVYDPITDSWNEAGELPFAVLYAKGFSINGSGYFVGGYYSENTVPSYELWKYNPETGNWSSQIDCPEHVMHDGPANVFILNDQYYTFKREVNSFIKYNSITGDWSYQSIDIDEYDIDYLLFYINGKVYFGHNMDILIEPKIISFDLVSLEWAVASEFVPEGTYPESSFQSESMGYIFSFDSTMKFWEFIPDL